ncbi:MAG: cytochrome c oxidase assembly protein [Fimbriimonadaceae bacterium]|nr:cytochrome c oxidase assembly protein [Alphaproteobacteria bacterium]
MTITVDNRTPRRDSRNLAIAAACIGLVAGMVGLAYAAVPLYRIFCQVTGYGGTTQVGAAPSAQVLDEMTVIRFDSNVMNGLNWSFHPAHGPVEIRIGETGMAYYTATNRGDKAATGTAVFNVTPTWAGQYFVKIECFCFTEQTLAPGETMDMPVQFYVDPEIVKDDAFAGLSTITLSYTFYPAEGDS